MEVNTPITEICNLIAKKAAGLFQRLMVILVEISSLNRKHSHGHIFPGYDAPILTAAAPNFSGEIFDSIWKVYKLTRCLLAIEVYQIVCEGNGWASIVIVNLIGVIYITKNVHCFIIVRSAALVITACECEKHIGVTIHAKNGGHAILGPEGIGFSNFRKCL